MTETTETAKVKAITITTAGEMRDVELDGDYKLAGLYAEIGCSLVEVVRLTDTLDMWVDEEFLYSGQPVNIAATLLAQAFGWTHQLYHGAVVLAEHTGSGALRSISPPLRAAVQAIVEM